MADLTEQITQAPTLPAPVETPEYYTGFGKEFEQIGVELQTSYTRLQKAETELNKPAMTQVMLGVSSGISKGFWNFFTLSSPLTWIMEAILPEDVKIKMTQQAQIEFDIAAKSFQLAEWKIEIMQTLPFYLSDPTYTIENIEDILQYVKPGNIDLTDADRAWLTQTYEKLKPLTNILPEGYQGDVLDAQTNILNNILTEPKVEMKGVHRLTVDEIAKAFVFGVAELPAGMTEEDVRNLLSKMDLQNEELQSQRDWLEERVREWETESARMNMIRAGEILANVPELTSLQWTKLIVTQPMMATVELMQKWWDTISRPISAAIMIQTPAPVSGALHGAATGAVAGAMVGSIVPVIGTVIGAGIGALVGAIGGTIWFSTWEDEASKELTKLHDFYISQGDSSWSAYAKAFNEWEAPWYQKMILDSAFDPLNALGFGAISAVGKKIATAVLPRGLKWAGTRIGSLMVAFEQGYVAGADAVFKGGMQVLAAPIKSAFWLTGAGYTIPKTYTQMARNFARKGLMDFKAVLDRSFPQVRNLRGLTVKDVSNTVEACVQATIKHPMEGNDLMVRAGANLLEFSYLNDVAATKLLKNITGELTLDTTRLARLNSSVLDAFSGQGERITAGKMLAELGIVATDDTVTKLAAKITNLKNTIAKKAISAAKGDTADEVLMSIFNRLESTRYGNLHSPLTQYMQQAGRSASWHSRVADRILYSTRIVNMERRLVMPIAKQQLLFTNFGPYNYLENSMRSFLGGAEPLHPKAYGGVAETNRLFDGLTNAPYELRMMERGEQRLTQAIIDPQTGRSAVFKGGKVPFVTRDVTIPEKVPILGGKKVGKYLTIGNNRYYLGSFQDWYDMWADLVSKQTAYDYQVHYLKALMDADPATMGQIDNIIDTATKPLLDNIPSLTKQDAFDIRRVLKAEATVGPDKIRLHADIDVMDWNRRQISKELNKTFDKLTDVHMITKNGIRDEVLDGTMFTKGTNSIDDRVAAWIASERELNIASLAPQMDALKAEVDAFIANPAKNLDDFLGDMQMMSSHVESVSERIHDFRRITELRKAKLSPADFDDFEVGSAKMLAQFMDTSEESLTKIMNQLMENAKAGAILNDVQLARLSDLDSISRLEMENILATRNKVADIEVVIPRTLKAARNERFWLQQRAQKSAIWDEYDNLSRRLKGMRLAASRNFLTSVDKPAFIPDFVPEVVGDLTPNHLAYLYGVTGDDLYRGLTRMQHHITVRPREDFIVHTKEQASAYAAKLGKTAEQLGFTDNAIGEVYDQMWRNLGVNPNMLTPDSPTVLQMEEVRQELYRLYQSTKIPESDVIKWRKYINTVADEVGNLDAYKAVAGAAPTVIETGQPYTAKLYRGTKVRGQPPTDEGLVGKGQYWSTSEDVAKTYGAAKEATITLRKPYAIKTQAEFDDFSNMRIRPIRDIADAEGRSEDWVQTMLRSQLENEGYDGVIIGAGIVEKGTQIAVFHPEKAVGVAPTTVPPVKAGVSGTPDWWATKESAMTKAREMHAMAYPTYDDANIIDETMRAIFPFWNYELFRWKWLPRTFLRTPGVMSGLARYMDYTDQGYIPVPGTDLQLNFLRGTVFMGGLRSMYLKDFPEFHDTVPGIEFLDYIGRAGFFPGIHVMLPVIGLSALGGTRPQIAELIPAWVKTSLSGLRALSPQHIGAVLDVIYPDRFRDYMTMMQLASMGYDGDEIWKKKQQGTKLTEEEEKLWLTATNKVDGIKGILMNQTGLFRIRPQEFTQIRQEMQLAIEEATGVPVKTQDWIDKMYPVTGKRFSDYFHLDIQQQALLYQWEAFRRYQGITTPLQPSSWQAIDIKRSDYYAELERIYTDARYNGVYEDGKLVQQSMTEINRQLIEGAIGPDQWRSARSSMQESLSSAASALGNSPAYKDVPKTFDELAALLEERAIVVPTQTPDQELLYYYYELSPELKWDWESERMEMDFDTYYAYIDILLETLSPTHRERLLERIQNDWTPMEKLYWQFSRDFARPYRNLRDVVMNQYTDEQRKLIRRYEVARGTEREELQEAIGPDGKLIAGYQSRLREARQRLRVLDSTLDAWLYFFGTTDKFMSHEAEEIYNGLAKQYLVPGMIGVAK